MVNLFDRVYTEVGNSIYLLDKLRIYSLLRLLIRLSANVVLPIYYFMTRHNKLNKLDNKDGVNDRIIVSLTSFPTRIGRLWLVVETLFRQTKKPYKIILWLSKDQFPEKDFLPGKLLEQCSRGLEIRFVDGDLRSHKKYFYTLREFPNDYMVTVDDDIFYRSTMIEDLYHYSLKYPLSVISQYSYLMNWKNEELASYASWKKIKEEMEPNYKTFFGSGGGTLFPPLSMDFNVFNQDLFMTLTPTADDIWLNAMCRLHKTKITVTKYHSVFVPVINTFNHTLDSINNGMNQNDKQINAVREYFVQTAGVDPFSELEL